MKIRNPKSAIENSRGVALIMVLWVIAVLSVIVLEFSFAMRTEVNLTRHYQDEVLLSAHARGGVQRAIAELVYRHDPRIQQMRKGLKIEEIPEEKREWMTDGRPYLLPYDRGNCEIRVMSEAGKVNINSVSDATLRKIITQMGLEGEERDVITDSILDWRDADDFYRLNGAENDYYQSLKEPYRCKNGPLDSIEELLLVRGVTPDLFYGKKAAPTGEGEKGDRIGLRDLFSIYSPGEQVDINSALVPVLRVVLGLPADVARSIVRGREESRFLNQQDLVQRVPEMAPFIGEAARFIVYQSTLPYYTVESKSTVKEGGATVGLKAIVKIDRREKEGYKVIQWVDRIY
jgi:general secretion pathway protein K